MILESMTLLEENCNIFIFTKKLKINERIKENDKRKNYQSRETEIKQDSKNRDGYSETPLTR